MERRRLTGAELDDAIQSLDSWEVVGDHLTKNYKFENFASALAWVNGVGELADSADHHPDITFGWGYARIELTTHDRGGITDVDIALAQKIDALPPQVIAPPRQAVHQMSTAPEEQKNNDEH